MQWFTDALEFALTLCWKKISAALSAFSSSSSSRNWSDLPGELVLEIANRLALVELYNFRGVCKDWRAATSRASAIVPPHSNSLPWLLIHQSDNPISTFYNSQYRTRYTAKLSELDTSTCIASNHGWLLLLQASKISFFFSPFSRAKIHLPILTFRSSEVPVGTFTGPPTSKECTVCVIHRIDSSSEVVINMLSRGAKKWTRISYNCPVERLGTVVGATSHEGTFYFFDNSKKLLSYWTKEKEWKHHMIVQKGTSILPFRISRGDFKSVGFQDWLPLGDDSSVSLCGGATSSNHIILNEKIEASEVIVEEAKCRRRQLKGIWVMQPSVPQLVPRRQRW